MQRPRLKRTLQQVHSPDGDVYLLRSSAKTDLRIEQPTAAERRLLAQLDGTHSLVALEREYPNENVAATVAQLQDLKVVEDAADDDLVPAAELTRFDRQLRYFSDVGDGELTPSECQRRLREAKVAVIGVGGLGGAAARSLASMGIGEMWLVDGDRVEVSNMNRQSLFTEDDLGEMKAETAAARLSAFNSGVTIVPLAKRLDGAEEIGAFIAGADFVIDAADWPAHDIERWCNAACFEAGIPYISMSHFAPIARVGPIYVPGQTGCYDCQETSYRRDFPLFDLVVEQRQASPSPAATLGPACELIGGLVALETMYLLTGLAPSPCQGVAHIYDLRTMEIERERVVPEPDCPVCGHLQPSLA